MTSRSTSITRFPAQTNFQGLSREELKKFPALFATAPSPKMSERYTFLSTADIIEPLLKEGYVVTHVRQRATRQGHRDPRFTRHAICLRRLRDKPAKVGDVYPQVGITNSHDGQCRWSMYGHLLRLACLNGMTISTMNFKGISLFHRGELDPILDQIRSSSDQMAEVLRIVDKMAEKRLTPAQQKRFAQRAAELVWDTVDFDTSVLLAPRRESDNEDDLWCVYNRIQENVIRGEVQIQHNAGQQRAATTRGITHIRRDIDFNIGLWQLAQRLAA